MAQEDRAGLDRAAQAMAFVPLAAPSGGSYAEIMMRRFRNTVLPRIMAVFLTLACPAIALAQNPPPDVSLSRSQPAWMGYGLMFLLSAAVIAISLMPSKRSHQD
ncbi:MAG: hypothetical protein ACYTGC_13795 [Planctomycetota bacterium]